MRSLGIGWIGLLGALLAMACGNTTKVGSGAGGPLGGAGGSGGDAGALTGGAGSTGHGGGTSSGGSAGTNATTGGASGNAGSGSGAAGVAGDGGAGGEGGEGNGESGGAGSGGGAGASGGGSGGLGGMAGGFGGMAGATGRPPELWLALWGGDNPDYSGSFAISPNHVVIAAGTFGSPTIDLDPTSGVDMHRHLRPVTTGMISDLDAFVVWLNADGTYRKGCTLPGNPGSFGGTLTVAAGADDSAILAGPFGGTLDFDPGPGERLVTSMRTGATFVLSLTSNCELAWGYALYDAILSDYLIAAKNRPLATDSKGNIYLIGVFTEFDFDLGPGEAVHTATPSGFGNAFLVKLSPSADLVWVRTWRAGGPSTLAVSPDDDTVVVGGLFGGTIDLDPTAGEDLHTAVGTTDAYAAAYDSDGNFLWGYSHGDATSRFSEDTVAVSANGSAILAAPHNLYLEHRAADGRPLWVWDTAYQVRYAQIVSDDRLVLLGRLSEGRPSNPADPPNTAQPLYGREFVSVFEANGTFVSSLAFGGESVDTAGKQLIVDDGYVYVGGTVSDSPVSNYSYLPEGSGYVSVRPKGADDAFLFRTRLPQ